ncbi:hypothetical protein M493_08667 [Geobacillus genomosp. 3]|uniref:Uncharacterized protein n=1 Tax=Geobacillus genomosp. 3 TaxID=1921421 RepID=V5LX11_GEOG3|nr:hypothetical protein M493_08667 [Geobacillus genomosp. 3]
MEREEGTWWNLRICLWTGLGSPHPKRVHAMVESRHLYLFLNVHFAVTAGWWPIEMSTTPSISSKEEMRQLAYPNAYQNGEAHGDRSVNFPS